MNEYQDRVHLSPVITRVLWWLSTSLFLLTEATIIFAISIKHADHSMQEILNICGMPLIAAVPWAVGMRGFSIVAKRFPKSDIGGFTAEVISRQFLYTQIAAYMMWSFFIHGLF
jgi:hypothetical protein